MNEAGTTIKGKDFSSRSVRETHEGIRFERCNFSEAELGGAVFEDCEFVGCNLSLTKVEACQFLGVLFRDCKLAGVDFSRCVRLPLDVSFVESKVANCNFSGLPLLKIKFQGCEVIDCLFEQADLREADFSGSKMTGTRFGGADLRAADFSLARDYAFDLAANRVKGVRVALPEAVKLLAFFDIDVK